MDWDELAELLAGAGLAHIATASVDGRPHVAVVAPFVEGDGLWVFTTRGSGKARNLAENPRMALVWRPGPEIYVQADAVLVDDLAEKARLWDSGLLPFDPVGFFGTPDNPDLVLVRVTPRSATVLAMGPTGPSRRTWRR